MSSEKSDTRIRILKSAWKLLEKAAGREVRMSDIARAAGISRQALYLHFPKRADLLIAVTRHIDIANDIDSRLAASRSAASGIERLDAYIEAWGNYIPLIHGVARAMISMQENDADARAAWADRMQAMRHGCQAAIDALAEDGRLAPDLDAKMATDMLWMQLSVMNWELLTRQCGWSQPAYVDAMKMMARRTLVSQA